MADGDETDRGPQRIDLTLEVPFGVEKTFDSQMIAWAQTTDARWAAGADHSLDPTFHDPTAGDGGTAYA